jgi:hypothetical protein
MDPGSAGYSFDAKKKRCAAYNVYHITQEQTIRHEEARHAGDVSTSASAPAASADIARPPSSLHAKDSATICGEWGGVQNIRQASADGAQVYMTTVQRWLHDGERFTKELFPYTSGF